MSSSQLLKVAISGKSGCGNSTVSRIVADRLDLKVINYTFKDMAKEMNVTFDQLCQLAEKESKYDLKLDKKQLEMVSQSSRCILGSRLAVWLLKEAYPKVYLFASPNVRAGRISCREGEDFQESLLKMTDRDKRDRQRYLKLYRIDIDEYDFVDLVIDTDHLDQNDIADRIIEFCQKT